MNRLLLLATVLPLMVQADPAFKTKDWRCTTERTVGIDVSQNLKPVNFTDREEYRIVNLETVLGSFDERDRGYILEFVDFEASRGQPDDVALIRPVSSDPAIPFSWSGCRIYNRKGREVGEYSGARDRTYESHQQIQCGLNDFHFNSLTGRFTTMTRGRWEDQNDAGEHFLNSSLDNWDYSFGFGTCEPYFD